MGDHSAYRCASDLRMLAERKQEPCHPLGPSRNLAVRPLVLGQVATLDGPGQRRGLTEGKAKALACDRIDRPRGVADQRNATAIDGFELAR